MHEFAIWAPRAHKMVLSVNGEAIPMRGPDERGWWRLEVDAASAGAEYGFLIDDDETVYPDPRSQCQPHGVHGLSRVYDHNAFDWSDAGFQPAPRGSRGV
jgi:maltooligosyltrehalose trehalohydrolase